MLVDSATNRGTLLSVLALDVDHFKAVNDTTATMSATGCSRSSPTRIKRNVRNVDLACRTGGEEFVIVLPATDRAVALKVAERLRRSVSARPFNVGAKCRTAGGHHLGRGRQPRIADRHARGAVEARRPRPLPRQAGRPQPGDRRRGLSPVFAPVYLKPLLSNVFLPRTGLEHVGVAGFVR